MASDIGFTLWSVDFGTLRPETVEAHFPDSGQTGMALENRGMDAVSDRLPFVCDEDFPGIFKSKS